MASNWRGFAVLFVGFVLLFASVLGFAATVEHDVNCSLTEVRDEPRGATVEYYYSELSPDQRQLFERLRENRGETVTDDACIGGIVRVEDRYYVVEERRNVVWTNGATLLSIGGGVVASSVIYRAVRREIDSLPW